MYTRKLRTFLGTIFDATSRSKKLILRGIQLRYIRCK